MKKILFISHYFPPIGGAGVQRSAKFVKYLPELGFLPIVLTGEAEQPGHWTPEDKSLLADIPEFVPVNRVSVPRALGSSQSRQNTARRRAFVTEGMRLIREHSLELIFVTMSPFSDSLIAAELAAKSGLPWVADLRDPWALDEFQVQRTWVHRMIEFRRMKLWLNSAASVIMNTPEAMRRFRIAFPKLKMKARVAITNGYDREDIRAGLCPKKGDKFTIIHSGYLHTEVGLEQQKKSFQYSLLGRTLPGVEILPRSHFYLIRAVEALRQMRSPALEHLHIDLLGVPTQADMRVVKRSTVNDKITFTGYIPHSECTRRIQSADLLFLPLHKVGPSQRSTIVPGKAYEYMATGRPILAAVPPGDARDFLTACGTARICAPDDVGEMARAIEDAFQAWSGGEESTPKQDQEAVERFERRVLSTALARELDRVISSGNSDLHGRFSDIGELKFTENHREPMTS